MLNLFKSKEARRIEAEIQIRKAISKVRRQVEDLKKHEKEWIGKASHARKIGSEEQLQMIRGAYKQTMLQRQAMEKQLLAFEMAHQRMKQVNAQAEFVKGMNEVGNVISGLFKSSNIVKAQQNIEMAVAKADEMDQRLGLFMDITGESLFTGSDEFSESDIPDSELDELMGLLSDEGPEKTSQKGTVEEGV